MAKFAYPSCEDFHEIFNTRRHKIIDFARLSVVFVPLVLDIVTFFTQEEG